MDPHLYTATYCHARMVLGGTEVSADFIQHNCIAEYGISGIRLRKPSSKYSDRK